MGMSGLASLIRQSCLTLVSPGPSQLQVRQRLDAVGREDINLESFGEAARGLGSKAAAANLKAFAPWPVSLLRPLSSSRLWRRVHPLLPFCLALFAFFVASERLLSKTKQWQQSKRTTV